MGRSETFSLLHQVSVEAPGEGSKPYLHYPRGWSTDCVAADRNAQTGIPDGSYRP